MTGYGRAEAQCDGNRVAVEIAAVNSRKQAELRFAMPRELAPLEPFLRKVAQNRLNRGSVTVSLSYSLNTTLRKGLVRIDADLAAELADELRNLASAAGLDTQLTLHDLLQLPGVVSETMTSPCDPLRDLAIDALNRAIDGLRSMQETEGAELKKDLQTRTELLQEMLRTIEARKDEALQLQRNRLLERARQLGLETLSVDDDRLAKEVTFYAERADITEELVRLHSHLGQFTEALCQTDEIGRALEFLCQEMNREVTTICAKTSDTTSSRIALELKTELGRVREQVMNVE